MKIIEIGDKKIELNIGEQLTVKELRVIYPIIQNNKGNEIEMVVGVIKAFSTDTNIEEIVNAMSIPDFTKLSEEISKIIDQKKK